MRKMKDSGVEWIGEIPEDWNITRCKYLSVFINGYAFDSNDFSFEYIYPVIRIGDICNGVLDLGHCQGITDNSGLETYKIRENDILLAMSGATVGKVGYVYDEEDAYVNQRVGIIRSNFAKYLYYALSTNEFIEYINLMNNSSAQPNVSGSIYGKFPVALPDNMNIRRLTDYLDSKCAKIDSIIAKQEQIIEKLKEYKLSLITEAVTKGLDPNVEMKDSGIDGIGKIPRQWNVVKLKYLCNTQGRIGFKGYTTSDLVDDGEGAYTVGATHLKDGRMDLSSPVYISWEKYYESPEIMVNKGDILIVQRGSTIGKVAIVDNDYGDMTINPSLVLINKIQIDNKYLLYALSTSYIADYINLIGTTTAIPMISQKQINELIIVLPEESEQHRIVNVLDHICIRINEEIEKRKEMMVKMQNFKKSLIYEVVTGKKEV